MRRVPPASIAAVAILSGCAPTTLPKDQPKHAHIDHVIVGTNDLESGMASIERLTGVRPAVGGAHTGQGTRNALLSLGDGTYLELYAPNPAEPVNSPEVRELRDLAGLRPLGWAIAPDDAKAMRSTLAEQGFELSPPEPGSRARPDGSELKWETFGFENFDSALAPFFIRWTQPVHLHPSRTSPRGCRLVAIRLQQPEPKRLTDVIRSLRLAVVVAEAGDQRMEVELACPTGPVSLR